MTDRSPEQVAGIWARLAELGAGIVDDETRAQFLGAWRVRFEREVSLVPVPAEAPALHALITAEDGSYAFPESESDSAAKLIAIVRRLLKLREERRAIGDEIRDVMAAAKLIGFDGPAITAALGEIESDMKNGPAVREEKEMNRVLYRRVLGIRGPMSEAMLPQVLDGRRQGASARLKKQAAMHALIDARAVVV